MNLKRGIIPFVALVVIALLAIGAGTAVYLNKASHTASTLSNTTTPTTSTTLVAPPTIESTPKPPAVAKEKQSLPPAEVVIPWHVELAVLDGIDVENKVQAPFAEAAKFIAEHSRFKIEYGVTVATGPHTYTHYDCGEGIQKCVVVNASDLTPETIASLPIKMSYILFWAAGKQPPLQAGSTWGTADGLLKDSVKHTYATIPTDLWWYNNDPFEGFTKRSSQIIAHETINIINSVLEIEPYNCPPLVGTPGDSATKYESDRLAKLTDACYARLPSGF